MRTEKINNQTSNQKTKISGVTIAMGITIGILILILIVVLMQISSLNAKMSSIDESINGITNNKRFSDVVNNMDESVFMVAVPVPPDYNPSLVDAIYTDDNGRDWKIGTGFVIMSKENTSYLLTAYHVVSGSKIMSIISKDLKTTQASFYSGEPNLDLAIVKVETKLKPVIIGKYDDVKVGSRVAFSGYPLNDPVAQITHEGIISFKGAHKNIPLFTVNSFVNKGNSGGPLFLSDTGEVVGVINAREYKPLSQQPLETIETTNNDSKIINNNLLKISNQLSAMSENVQMGIGKATPIDQSILSLIKE